MEMVAVTMEQVDDNSSITSAGSEEPFFSNFILAIKIATGLASGLSLLGAITVIIYQLNLGIRDIKEFTVVRLTVIMLSVADFLVAVSHIWGATQNIQMFMEETTVNSSYADTQCTAQAVFTVFGSLSSSMWTLALVSCVFVMYCMQGMTTSICERAGVIISVFVLCNFLCWGFPFLLVIILGRLYHLGYAETANVGWCYISLLATEPNVKFNEKLVLPLSYESWTWLIILIIAFCIVGCIVVFCCNQLYRKDENVDPQQRAAHDQAPSGDPNVTAVRARANTFNRDHQANPGVGIWRPVLAGVFFLILRMPSTVIDSILFVDKGDHHELLWLGVVILIAAIGDSLQGLVNSFLFVWCRPDVYRKVYECCTGNAQPRRGYEEVP